MKKFGFSTGALAKGNFKKGLRISKQHKADAVEYSALRREELEPLADYLLQEGTGGFKYVSFHSPSQFSDEEERPIVQILKNLAERFQMHIVVHPDAIRDYESWRELDQWLCIENMDHRKPAGRTADELAAVFDKVPKASLCFDIGHAHQIDRSMSIGYEILRRFADRVVQVHASEVSDDCEHHPFSLSAQIAFEKLADMIPDSAAVILETVVPEDQAHRQLEIAKEIFGDKRHGFNRVGKRKREPASV